VVTCFYGVEQPVRYRMKNLPLDLKRKLVCDEIVANRQLPNGTTLKGTLANNISPETAQRILDRWRE
jgi:hypothetical protein